MKLKSINPATGEILEEFEEWNNEQIQKELNESSQAFNNWKETSFSERSVLLKKVAQLLQKNQDKYSRLITLEMGKPIVISEMEIEKCAEVCEYYAENSEEFLKNEYVKTEAKSSYVRFVPLGAVLAVMPWNFPFWQVFRCIAPVLMAGNVLVLKHSSNVPQCAIAIEEIFREAGFPDNVVRAFLVSSKTVDKIIKDDRIAAVSLTGSCSAGRSVAEKAGVSLKKVVLELGGNDPFIVLKDADLDLTVKQAIRARMMNSGQSCTAAKRFIVVDEIFDEFEKVFSEKVEQLVIGDPMDRSTKIGPIARKDLLEQLEIQVNESIQKGAIVLTGGERLEDNPGFYYLPTVLSNVKRGMPAYDEETFGPVASLVRVKGEKEAIAIANDTCFGLGASIWTENLERGESLIKQVQAGSVFVNDMVKSDLRMPFGSIKKSGFGRELSVYGIKEFVNIQTVWIK